MRAGLNWDYVPRVGNRMGCGFMLMLFVPRLGVARVRLATSPRGALRLILGVFRIGQYSSERWKCVIPLQRSHDAARSRNPL